MSERSTLPTTMRAALLDGVASVATTTRAIPPVGPGDLLIAVDCAGVCGSDVAVWRGTHPYKTAPAVLGHELAGTVVAIGDRVVRRAVGDRVCAAAFAWCGRCPGCAEGRPNLCVRRRNLSADGWDGAFAEYVVVPESAAFALPPVAGSTAGALVEPLAIALHALRRPPVSAGADLVVLGSGGIGLSTAVCAPAAGYGAVTCVDVADGKDGVVAGLGTGAAYVDARGHGLDGLTAHVTVVAAGYPGVLDDARRVTRPGGHVVVVSFFDGPQTVALNALVRDELTLHTSSLATPGDFHTVLDWLAEGRIDPETMVTHRFALTHTAEALALLGAPSAGNATGIGKVVVDVGGEAQ